MNHRRARPCLQPVESVGSNMIHSSMRPCHVFFTLEASEENPRGNLIGKTKTTTKMVNVSWMVPKSLSTIPSLCIRIPAAEELLTQRVAPGGNVSPLTIRNVILCTRTIKLNTKNSSRYRSNNWKLGNKMLSPDRAAKIHSALSDEIQEELAFIFKDADTSNQGTEA